MSSLEANVKADDNDYISDRQTFEPFKALFTN